MIGRWLANRRRGRWLAERVPGEYREWLATDTPFFSRLTGREQDDLIDLARVFVREKAWDPREGFELAERVKLSIAAQACLLLLHLPNHNYYANVERIVIFPASYGLPMQDGVLVSEVPVLGQANYRGPVVLAWASVASGAKNPGDGRNVVFHEFAHKLDMLDGWIDGTPRLSDRAMFDRWVGIMTESYDDLREAAREHRRSVLDRYGATNPAEFFAVATETFFEKPDAMRQAVPELYALLVDYYHQDPAGWSTVAG
jgi:Mlc titration factor MtfA (ptsG expression regulator)